MGTKIDNIIKTIEEDLKRYEEQMDELTLRLHIYSTGNDTIKEIAVKNIMANICGRIVALRNVLYYIRYYLDN